MFYKDILHCQNAMIKLLNKHSSRYGINEGTREQLIYLAKSVYMIEKYDGDKFTSSVSDKLYSLVKNDLESAHELRSVFDYIGELGKLRK